MIWAGYWHCDNGHETVGGVTPHGTEAECWFCGTKNVKPGGPNYHAYVPPVRLSESS